MILLLLAQLAAVASEAPARLWVRIEDDRGRPTAARIYLRDAAGQPHSPPGSLARINRTNEWFFHAAGQFQLEMPAGEASIEAVKGFEYTPVTRRVRLEPNRTTALTLTLRRLTDLPAQGWHSGDVHMHPNHVEGGVYMTMEDCRLYAEAEDIRVANLLISSTDSDWVFDTEHFRDGRPDPLSTAETLLVVQQEFRNTSAMYGHMPLLGIQRLVRPFFSGQPLTAHWEDYPANYHIAREVKAQGGAVCYTHPANRPETPVGPHLAREFPIDLALGVVDALDVLGNGDEEAACWMYYRVLNCGLKCSASSGSDSRMDVMRHAVSGGGKVYVKAGNPLTYPNWVAAYKAGRTFVTNGPIVRLEVDGREPGEEIHLPAAGTVTIKARAESLVPFGALELIVNGKVAASTAGGAITHRLHLETSSWIAARVWGERHRLVVNDPRVFAHTSPVYCYVNKQPIGIAEDARLVLAWIDRLIRDVESSPRFSTEARRREVLEVFGKGRRYYAGRE